MQASKKLSTTKTHNNQAMQFRFKKRKKKAMQFREMVKEIYIYIKKNLFWHACKRFIPNFGLQE